MADDPAEQAHLQNLRTLIGGMSPSGTFIPDHERDRKRIEAGDNYMSIRQKQASQEAWHLNHKLEVDKQKHDQSMAEAQLQLEAHNEARRLDLEYERLEIAKAEVIVRALEAAARHPELSQLIGVVRDLSQKLLVGTPLPSLQIEDQNTKED
jgi:hypothetical protein